MRNPYEETPSSEVPLKGRARSVLVLAVLASALVPGSSRAAPAGFVTSSGGRLMLEGAPWRAIGMNLWDMDAYRVVAGDINACWYTHADLDTYLDESFRVLSQTFHATVARTFGFRAMYTGGGTDWSPTDKLLYYARKWNVRVIPVFGDQYGTCGSPAKDPSWYRDGFRTHVERPWGITYHDYVVRTVQRYRDDPTIALWQLMNEATAGTDTSALLSFSRDMVRAIRVTAGDANHLINLGTVGGGAPGNELPGYARLLDCPSTGEGGCNDLAEAHMHNPSSPLPGLPMLSSVDAVIDAWNTAGQHRTSAATRVRIDGWTTLTLPLPDGPQQPYRSWALRLNGPAASGVVAYLDEATVQTLPTPQSYTFEAGTTEGFTATGGTLTNTTEVAGGGLRSLRAAVAPGSSSVTFTAPAIGGTPSSITVAVRLNFRAPAPDEGASVAADQHAAVVTRAKPFLLGELGYDAQVPGVGGCGGKMTLTDRAAAFNEAMGAGLDAARGGSGVIAWDFKDPTQRSTHADGTLIADPNIGCMSITPTDPAVAVFRSWADQTPNTPALPAPAPLPAFAPRMFALQAPSGEVGYRADVPVTIRLTHGGDAMRGVRLVGGDGCFGSGTTNALGLAAFSCHINQLGTVSLSVTPDPPTCGGCVVPPLRFPVVSKRSVVVTAVAGIVERGTPAPVRITIADPLGGSVAGIEWTAPECGTSGTVSGPGSTATIVTACSTSASAWRDPQVLTVHTAGNASTIAADAAFVGIAFDRVYVDAVAGDCVGLSKQGRIAGVTRRPGACAPGSYGAYTDWLIPEFKLPTDTFRAAGPLMVVDADLRDGTRIEGVFQWEDGRAFAAAILRPAGPAALASA